MVVLLILFVWKKDQIVTYIETANYRVQETTLETFKVKETGYIYASDGTCIAQLREGANSSYLEFSEIPDIVLKSFIAIEDKRFYQHQGVDWFSTAKSCVLLLKNHEATRGGSTITQQVARNVFSDIGFQKSIDRKLQEMLTAIFLEKKYSKNLILEFYVNNINFGNNCIGISAASKKYFNKEVSELTIAEVAYLCAIPNNPTLYNPLENNENVVKRRNVIINELYQQGFITELDFLEAINSPVHLSQTKQNFYNYEASFAIHCAAEQLMKLNEFNFKYTFKDEQEFDSYWEDYNVAKNVAIHQLYTQGFKIHTSLDLEKQKKVQKVFDRELKSLSKKDENGVYLHQGAVTVIDNVTGKVIAAIGGRSQTCISKIYSLNRSFQTYRQPGSTIKPLIVYTPIIEKGYNADTIVDDSKIEKGPKNVDETYEGEITLKHAVEKSKNVVAWRLFKKVKPKKGLSYLSKMQFDKITPNDYYLPAALGGLYYGVTTTQMASGYATLVNDGIYFEPTCINSIQTSEGVELMKIDEGKKIYSKKATREMMYILSGVAKEGTAKGLKLEKDSTMPIICKTGTSNEQTVAWFCGATPQYTIATYVGRDDNKPTKGLWGNSYPLKVWKEAQDALYTKEDARTFSYMKDSKYSSKKTEVLSKDSEETIGKISDILIPEISVNSSKVTSTQAQTEKQQNRLKEEHTEKPKNEKPKKEKSKKESTKETVESSEKEENEPKENTTKEPTIKEPTIKEPTVKPEDIESSKEEIEETTNELTLQENEEKPAEQIPTTEPVKEIGKPINSAN